MTNKNENAVPTPAQTAQKVVDACAAWIENVDTSRLKSILREVLIDGIDTMESMPDDTAMLHQTIILIEDLENTDDMLNAKCINTENYEQN